MFSDLHIMKKTLIVHVVLFLICEMVEGKPRHKKEGCPRPNNHNTYRNCINKICEIGEVYDYPGETIWHLMQKPTTVKLFGPILNSTVDFDYLQPRPITQEGKNNFYNLLENDPWDCISGLEEFVEDDFASFINILERAYHQSFPEKKTGFSRESEPLCRSTSPISFMPHVMQNWNGVWKYVVNVKGAPQKVTIQSCYKEERAIQELNQSDDLCYLTFQKYCYQAYQEVYLVVYDSCRIDFDKFFIPIRCECGCSWSKMV